MDHYQQRLKNKGRFDNLQPLLKTLHLSTMVNRGQEVHCEACIEGAHCCCERYEINSQDVHNPTSEEPR
jgi:hypothetical protein